MNRMMIKNLGERRGEGNIKEEEDEWRDKWRRRKEGGEEKIGGGGGGGG